MGFYGRIVTGSNQNLQFDRVYPNKFLMDAMITGDNVFIGRKVLIDYESYSIDSDIFEYERLDNKYIGICVKQVGITFYIWKGKITNSLSASGKDDFDIKDVEKYETIFDLNYAFDKIDSKILGRGYDNTAWQKMQVEDEAKYIHIADLNSVVPEIEFLQDPPTSVPMNPHYDEDKTNVKYTLHTQPTWGFRIAQGEEGKSDEKIEPWERKIVTIEEGEKGKKYVEKIEYANNLKNENGVNIPEWKEKKDELSDDDKLNAAIYYNKDGFDKTKSSKADVEDSIKLIPAYSGNEYHKVPSGVPDEKERYPDVQELSINLPSIGNTISDVWDIVYGENRSYAPGNEAGKYTDDQKNSDKNSLKGIMERANIDTTSIENRLNTISGEVSKLDTIEKRLDDISSDEKDGKLDIIEDRLDDISNEVDKLDTIEDRLNNIMTNEGGKLNEIEDRLDIILNEDQTSGTLIELENKIGDQNDPAGNNENSSLFARVKYLQNEGWPDPNVTNGEGECSLVQKGSGNKAITENSTALGKDNIAGGKGFYIKNIDFVNKAIYLSNDKDGKDIDVDTTGYAAKDDISIVALVDRTSENIKQPKEEHWHYCAKIVSVEGNKITYDVDLPFTALAETDDDEFHTFAVAKKPHVGSKIIGIRAFTAGGNANIAFGQDSYAEGRGNIAAGKYAHAEGRASIAGYSAHAEGMTTKALSMYSHAEGESTISTGKAAHAEGGATTATAQYSHAEGLESHAEASSSHVEGIGNRAKGSGSHAEGYGNKTLKNARFSHVEGSFNIVGSQDQHVQGRANIEDANNDYADIVGNGTINDEHSAVYSRSNAYTLDWEGNGRFAGDVYVHGSLKDSTDAKKLATEDYAYSKNEADIKFLNTEAINPDILSNSIKGTASGNKEVVLEDISNLSHNIDVSLLVTEGNVLPQELLVYSGNLICISKDTNRSNYTSGSRFDILDKENSIRININNGYYSNIYFNSKGFLEIMNKIAGQNLTFSIKKAHSKNMVIAVQYNDKQWESFYSKNNERSITFSTDPERTIIQFEIRPYNIGTVGTETETIVEEMQLTIGSEVKPYTPYGFNTLYAVNPDGTVDNVKSTYPKTILIAISDSDDVNINVVYNKDINVVVDNIETKLNNKATIEYVDEKLANNNITSETHTVILSGDAWIEENTKYTYSQPMALLLADSFTDSYSKTIIFDIASDATLEQRQAAEKACLYGNVWATEPLNGVYYHYLEIGMTSDNKPEIDIPLEVVVM